MECELSFSNVWFGRDSFGVEVSASHIQVNSSQGIEAEDEEELVEEEYEEFLVEGKIYLIKNKHHGSFIYEDTDKVDEVGEEVGVFVNGIYKFFV